jgi:hypothetical protein
MHYFVFTYQAEFQLCFWFVFLKQQVTNQMLFIYSSKIPHTRNQSHFRRVSRVTLTYMTGTGGREFGGKYGEKGVMTSTNVPSSRYAPILWIDSRNHLWMYGGGGITGGMLNDLWSFDTEIGWWVWLSGTGDGSVPVEHRENFTADPGGRTDGMSFIDSNNTLYIYGGVCLRHTPPYMGTLSLFVT